LKRHTGKARWLNLAGVPFSSYAGSTPFRSSAKESAPPAAGAAGSDLPDRLVVEEERDERRQLSNLLIGQQLLRRRTVDRHLVERLILGGAHPIVRLVEVVLVGQRREVFGDRRPDGVDDLAVGLVEDRDA